MNSSKKAADTIERLRTGNASYVARGGKPSGLNVSRDEIERATPVAAVLVCSDIKAYPEQVFGLGPGELYVMQTAANSVGDAVAAGAVFVKETNGIELVVVLGHGPCGVVDASESMTHGPIFHELHQSRAKLQASGGDRVESASSVARVHASRMAEALREKLSGNSGISVAAAYLDEATGKVEFL